MSFATLVLAPVCEVWGSEKVNAPRGWKLLVLQKVVADSAKINSEFDGVIADDLGPVIYRNRCWTRP